MIGEILDQDPYLAYQPAFVHSLPIQLFVNAITITLLCVLFIHLLCQSSPCVAPFINTYLIPPQSPHNTTIPSPRSITASNSYPSSSSSPPSSSNASSSSMLAVIKETCGLTILSTSL